MTTSSLPGLQALRDVQPGDDTWLHVPDLHGNGYADVMYRDDRDGCYEPDRGDDSKNWWSFHQHRWISWNEAKRHGAASPARWVLFPMRYEEGGPEPDPYQARERQKQALAAMIRTLHASGDRRTLDLVEAIAREVEDFEPPRRSRAPRPDRAPRAIEQ